jgi:ABC-type sugar transport system ATPase subunit
MKRRTAARRGRPRRLRETIPSPIRNRFGLAADAKGRLAFVAQVVLKNLDKVFSNGVHAVRELSLEVADGELVVLVGPSGCGKTTTLRMIAGLEQPTRGQIYIGDRMVNDVAPKNRDVAMVFQGYALYPHMSVRQNMAFGLAMRRTPHAEIERRVRHAAEILSIEPLLDRRPGELSGGERQRVALGRAIVREPKVFLFDEPLSNLDAKLRVEMRNEIARLHERLKTTIIYVTHDQLEAMTLGERLVLMDAGSIQQTGPPMEIYRRPANRFVASFIGSPAMNFFIGEVREGLFRGDANVLGPVGVQASDGPAVLGVRPQDLLVETDGHPFANVTVDAVEHLGHESFARFSISGHEHIVRLPAGSDVQRDQRLALSIRPAAFHLFSASGLRLN